jgi:N-methylhydantoinase B/oxoprolinase/acetone carboxylase alpha subunit
VENQGHWVWGRERERETELENSRIFVSPAGSVLMVEEKEGPWFERERERERERASRDTNKAGKLKDFVSATTTHGWEKARTLIFGREWETNRAGKVKDFSFSNKYS